MQAINAITLRTQVSDLLRERIIDGRLPAGSRLVESRLIKAMGVSRTPLREALLGLEKEGLVESIANKGFHVTPANPLEVADLYPVLSTLEALAIRSSDRFSKDHCKTLRSLNERIRNCKNREKLYRLDLSWHKSLCSGCQNSRLLEIIDAIRLRLQVNRFDGAERRGMADVASSCDQHEAVIVALEKGDLEAAAGHIESHWRFGTQVVLSWIDEQANAGVCE